MWKPKYSSKSHIQRDDFEQLIAGKIPAIILRDFYDEYKCQEISKKILSLEESDFQTKNLNHIGPFLMSYSTRKKEYFEKAKNAEKVFKKIFSDEQNPSSEIFKMIRNNYPEFSVSLAREKQNEFSPFVIRVHENGKSIPIHKDNVKYEGIEYEISQIDSQLSCVLHLQESEKGGDIIIYDKNWKREDEKFRKIDFGYNSNVILSTKFCKISDVKRGDLVIINPNYYHQVTEICGKTPRVSLGMFIGMHRIQRQVVAWA